MRDLRDKIWEIMDGYDLRDLRDDRLKRYQMTMAWEKNTAPTAWEIWMTMAWEIWEIRYRIMGCTTTLCGRVA